MNAREPPWEAVVREVREELKVEVQVSRVCGVYHIAAKDDLVLTFACEVAAGQPKPGDEIEEVGWFEPMHLPESMRERHAERILDAVRESGVIFRSES